MEKANYTIIWKHFEKGSETGIRFSAKDKFSLPHFVDGVEKDRFEKSLPVSLNVVHLIKGLLVGYFDKPPNTDTSFAKEHCKEILLEQLEIFKSASLADFILDFAAHLREQNGNEASLQALMTGIEIVPDSDNIKYDCALDLFNCIQDNLLDDYLAATQKLAHLVSEIDGTKLTPELAKDLETLKQEVNKK